MSHRILVYREKKERKKIGSLRGKKKGKGKREGYSKTTSICVKAKRKKRKKPSRVEKKKKNFFIILSAFHDLRPRVLLRDIEICLLFSPNNFLSYFASVLYVS